MAVQHLLIDTSQSKKAMLVMGSPRRTPVQESVHFSISCSESAASFCGLILSEALDDGVADLAEIIHSLSEEATNKAPR